jgi:hypothetical protein
MLAKEGDATMILLPRLRVACIGHLLFAIIAFACFSAAMPAYAAVIYSQTFVPIGGNQSDPKNDGIVEYENFDLLVNSELQSITWRGLYIVGAADLLSTDFKINIFNDNHAPYGPGSLASAYTALSNQTNATLTDIPFNSSRLFVEFTYNLAVPLDLSSGLYWISIYANTSAQSADTLFYWASGDPANPKGDQFSRYAKINYPNSGCGIDSNVCPNYQTSDHYFILNGTQVSDVPIPAALPLFAAGLGAMGLMSRRKKRKATVAA